MTSLLNDLGAAAGRAGFAMLAQTAALAFALLAVELIAGRRLRATLRCALWMLVVAKLLLPPSLALPTGVAYWLGPWMLPPEKPSDPTVMSVSVSSGAVEDFPGGQVREPTSIRVPGPTSSFNLSAGLVPVWLAGAAVMLGVIVRRNLEVRCLVRDSEPASPAHQRALHEAAGRIGLQRLPLLRMTHQEHSPAVCGLFRPIVLLPRTLASALSPTALQDVLLHELVHVHRRDLWMNIPQTLALVLWWWNPVVWLAQARIRSLREQAVDDRVMVVREGDPESYPATLLEVARHCAARPTLALGLVGIVESRGTLRARVERLLGSPVPRRAHLGAGGWMTVVVAGLLFLPMAFARRTEPASPAASNPPTPTTGSTYHMDPVLARRYGLVPATNAVRGKPVTNMYLMDPVLARRYGLIPSTNASNPEANAPMSPELMRRYGLVPATNRIQSQPGATVYPMDPVMARRYGLIPPPTAPELHTRSYHVSTNTFVDGLQAVTGVTLAPNAGPAEIISLVKDFFRACGVEFPTSNQVDGGDPAAMQRAIYYNDRRGVLFVRATLRDLDVIEKAIEAFNVAPPQVQLEVRFVEIGPETSLQIESDQLSVNTESRTITAVLTLPQFDRMIQGLESHPGTKVLATPKVSTLSGRGAQISMIQEVPAVDRRTGETQKLPIGPVLVVTPQVLVEPPSVRLDLAAHLHQVTDAEDPDTGVPQVVTHEFAATVPALDGHTVLLFADPSGRDPASASAKRARRVLVFVTPVIVDPAGNRVNPPGK